MDIEELLSMMIQVHVLRVVVLVGDVVAMLA